MNISASEWRAVEARLRRTAQAHRNVAECYQDVAPSPDHHSLRDYQIDAAALHERLCLLALDKADEIAVYADEIESGVAV